MNNGPSYFSNNKKGYESQKKWSKFCPKYHNLKNKFFHLPEVSEWIRKDCDTGPYSERSLSNSAFVKSSGILATHNHSSVYVTVNLRASFKE